MDMQNYTTPFANTGDKEEFSISTDPSGKVSLEKGWTELYQLRPEEGGLFILRKIFNQMMNLVSTDTVTWKIQSFPNWINDKGDGIPYAYPKNAIVKYTNGNIYVSKVANNTALPTSATNWVKIEDFGILNINTLTDKTTPVNTDNLAIQETGGLFKKLSWSNLKTTLVTYLSTGTGFAISLTTNGYIKLPSWLGGLIIQWGTSTIGESGTFVTLPIAFPNNMFAVTAGLNDTGLPSGTFYAYRKGTSLSQIVLDFNTASTGTATYIVIGH